MDTLPGTPAFAQIGDTNLDSSTCIVVITDINGDELQIVEAPEDDLIPYMRTRGYRFGIYQGNNVYALLP